MKRSRFLIIATLLVAAAATVAIVSCKKDTPSAMLDNKAGLRLSIRGTLMT